jgi:hypothetical protein
MMTTGLIGRKVDDPEIKKDMKHWPFKIVEKNSRPHIRVNHKGGAKDFVSVGPEGAALRTCPSSSYS